MVRDKDFQESPQENRRKRISTEERKIEALVATEKTGEAWSKIHRWYRQAKGNPTPPTREVMEHTSTLREDLYKQCPSEGEATLIIVKPSMISDRPPEGEDISLTVRRLRTGRAEGP